jgi:hypothetical protein
VYLEQYFARKSLMKGISSKIAATPPLWLLSDSASLYSSGVLYAFNMVSLKFNCFVRSPLTKEPF